MATIPGVPEGGTDSDPRKPIRSVVFESSFIRGATYNQPLGKLTITMIRGDEYVCDGVSSQIADEFFTAPSAGTYFNERIKGKFSGSKPISFSTGPRTR